VLPPLREQQVEEETPSVVKEKSDTREAASSTTHGGESKLTK